MEVTGSPLPVLEGVRVHGGGAANYEIAANGSLLYIPGAGRDSEWTLAWAGPDGKTEPLAVPARRYHFPSISLDGRRVAVEIQENPHDIYVYDLRRNTLTRLTFESANHHPVFNPDGKKVVFASGRGGGPDSLWWKPADGSGPAGRLTTAEQPQIPSSWSPDGKSLLYWENSPETKDDIYVLTLGENPAQGSPAGKVEPFIQTSFDEWDPQFSPDGRWVAYTSDERRRPEIYVVPYPGPGGKWQVSTAGGFGPVWSRDGRRLFYSAFNDRLMEVGVSLGETFSPGTPRVVLEGVYLFTRGGRDYDVAPGGKRFLVSQLANDLDAPSELGRLRVVLNWFDELRARTSPAQ